MATSVGHTGLLGFSRLPLLVAALFGAIGAGAGEGADWVVTGAEVIENQSKVLDGNLIVESGGSLTLRGATLTFANTADGQHGIRVKSGGAIAIEANSLVTTVSNVARMYFTVEAGASLVMRTSELRRCGWTPVASTVYGEGNGLVISADNPVIENNTFTEDEIISLITPGSGGRIVANRFLSHNETGCHLQIIFRSGATIADNTFGPVQWFGISLMYANSTVIRNNTFDHTSHGPVGLMKSWDNDFSHNRVIGGEGPYVLRQSGNTSITDNTFEDSDAITVINSDNATIMRNTFTGGVNWKVLLSYSSHSVVADNTIGDITDDSSSSLASIELLHASDNIIANNRIGSLRVGDKARIGILVWGSSRENQIRGNEIGTSRRGISIHYGSDHNTVVNNTIQPTTEQPIVVEASSGNTLHHNNFLGGGRGPLDDTGDNSWDDGQQGNYWGDYHGDGSGPYAIAPSATDSHPLLVQVAIQHVPAQPNPPLPITIESRERLDVASDLEIRDQTVGPYSNVTVHPGGRLTLRNATLLMVGDEGGIVVKSGGALGAFDSRIVPPTVDEGGFVFQVLPGGTLVMKRSELRGVGKHPGCGDWASLYALTSGVVIEDSAITDCMCGLSLVGEGLRVLRNVVSQCEFGMSVAGGELSSSGAEIVDNQVSRCIEMGIVTGGKYNRIVGNMISNVFGWGLVNYDHWALVTGNTFADCGGGASSGASTTYCLNNFIRNAVQVRAYGGETWDCDGRGNYWSDYTGVDSNYDGIGDTPYLIPGGGQDSFPLVRPVVGPQRSLRRHLTRAP